MAFLALGRAGESVERRMIEKEKKAGVKTANRLKIVGPFADVRPLTQRADADAGSWKSRERRETMSVPPTAGANPRPPAARPQGTFPPPPPPHHALTPLPAGEGWRR